MRLLVLCTAFSAISAAVDNLITLPDDDKAPQVSDPDVQKLASGPPSNNQDIKLPEPVEIPVPSLKDNPDVAPNVELPNINTGDIVDLATPPLKTSNDQVSPTADVLPTNAPVDSIIAEQVNNIHNSPEKPIDLPIDYAHIKHDRHALKRARRLLKDIAKGGPSEIKITSLVSEANSQPPALGSDVQLNVASASLAASAQLSSSPSISSHLPDLPPVTGPSTSLTTSSKPAPIAQSVTPPRTPTLAVPPLPQPPTMDAKSVTADTKSVEVVTKPAGEAKGQDSAGKFPTEDSKSSNAKTSESASESTNSRLPLILGVCAGALILLVALVSYGRRIFNAKATDDLEKGVTFEDDSPKDTVEPLPESKRLSNIKLSWLNHDPTKPTQYW
jgi:hypothetical protein